MSREKPEEDWEGPREWQGAMGLGATPHARERTGEMNRSTEAFGSSGAAGRSMFKEKLKSKPIPLRGLDIWHEETLFSLKTSVAM